MSKSILYDDYVLENQGNNSILYDDYEDGSSILYDSYEPEKVKPYVPLRNAGETLDPNYIVAPPAPNLSEAEEKKPKTWVDYAKKILYAPTETGEEFSKIGHKGLRGVNSMLGISSLEDLTRESLDYNKKISQIENIEFRYKDMIKLTQSAFGDKKAKKYLQDKRRQTDKELDAMFRRFGFEELQINDSGDMRLLKNGKYHYIDDGFWSGLTNDVKSARSELFSDLGGGALGGAVANALNKDPKRRAVSTFVGVLGGAGLGAIFGRQIDLLRNAVETRRELSRQELEEAGADASLGSVTAGAIGAGAIKALETPITMVGKGIKGAARYVTDKNSAGAVKWAKQTTGIDEAEIAKLQAQREKYENDPVHGFMYRKMFPKEKDKLTVMADSSDSLVKPVIKEMRVSPFASKHITDNVDKRAKNVLGFLEKKAGEPNRAMQHVRDFVRGTNRGYGEVKEYLVNLPHVKTTIDDLGVTLDDGSRMGFKEVKDRLASLYDTSPMDKELSHLLRMGEAKGELDLADLFRAKEKANYALKKASKGAETDYIRAVKQRIINRIDEVLESTPNPQQARAIFREMEAEYTNKSQMLKAQAYKNIFGKDGKKAIDDNEFYNKAFYESTTNVDEDLVFKRTGEKIENTINEVTLRLPHKQRVQAEMNIILGLAKRATWGVEKTKQQAIDFKDLANSLRSVKGLSDEANEVKDFLIGMGELFRHDVQYLGARNDIRSEALQQGISTQAVSALKTMWRNMVINSLMPYLPKIGNENAFRLHVIKSLKQSRTPKEFLGKMLDADDIPRDVVDSLFPIYKQMLRGGGDDFTVGGELPNNPPPNNPKPPQDMGGNSSQLEHKANEALHVKEDLPKKITPPPKSTNTPNQVSYEAMPSEHLTGNNRELYDFLHNDVKGSGKLAREFDDEMDKIWFDESGEHKLFSSLGINGVKKSPIYQGMWNGVSNPSRQLVVPNSASKEQIELVASIKGLVLKQDGVGYHRAVFSTANPKEQNGVLITFENKITRELLERLEKDTKLDLVADPDGVSVRAISFDEGDFSGLKDSINEILKNSEYNYGNADTKAFRSEGALVTDWGNKERFNEEFYINKIKELTNGGDNKGFRDSTKGRPNLSSRLDNGRNDNLWEDYAKQADQIRTKWLKRARKEQGREATTNRVAPQERVVTPKEKQDVTTPTSQAPPQEEKLSDNPYLDGLYKIAKKNQPKSEPSKINPMLRKLADITNPNRGKKAFTKIEPNGVLDTKGRLDATKLKEGQMVNHNGVVWFKDGKNIYNTSEKAPVDLATNSKYAKVNAFQNMVNKNLLSAGGLSAIGAFLERHKDKPKEEQLKELYKVLGAKR